MQTAACYRMSGDLKEAAEVYEHGEPPASHSGSLTYSDHPLVKSADPTNNDAKMKLAEIYEILNEPRKALELVYEGISLLVANSLSLAYFIPSVIDSSKKRSPTASTSATRPWGSLFEETRSRGTGKSSGAPTVKAQNRLSHAQLRELEEQKESEVLKGWKRVKELWPRLLSSGDGQEEVEMEWLLEAEKLVETFRETRNLFLTTRVRCFCFLFYLC
jgi:general transcription factor 3C polypeptide 3 (transcription factor C subunit 4)